jgi:hypothetical protein
LIILSRFVPCLSFILNISIVNVLKFFERIFQHQYFSTWVSTDYTNPVLLMGDHAMDTLQSGLYGGGHRVLGLLFRGLANYLAAYGNPGLSAATKAGVIGFTLGGGGRSPFGQSGL